MKLFTERGYDFYEVSSALQKSIRRGDEELAGYFALELFPKYYNYCWKRLLTISAEDCDGIITQEIKSLYDSFMLINKGKKTNEFKGRIFISKAVIILCRSAHNRDADILQNYIYDKNLIDEEKLNNYLEEVRKENKEIPEYVFDCHTLKGKRAGKTKTDFFIQEELALYNKQNSKYEKLVLESENNA